MKREYPETYKKIGIDNIASEFPDKDKKKIEKFLTFVRSTAGEHKTYDRKKDIIQVRDIIEKSFDDWNYDDIVGYLSVLNKSNRNIWTKKGLLITLSVFLKWNFDDWSKRFKNLEILKKIQNQLKPNNSKKYNEKTMPTPEDVDKLIRAATNTRDKLYISLASEAGLPPAVELSLKFNNLKIDYPEDGITTLTYFRNKNQESFTFPLKVSTYYLKQWKQEYCYPNRREDDLLFPSPIKRDKSLSAQTAWIMLERLRKKAGIEKHLFQYLFRHKTLSDSYRVLTEEVHRKIFGHVKGSRQTATYSHIEAEEAFNTALQQLHKLEIISPEKKHELEIKYDKLQNYVESMIKKLEKKGYL